MESTRETSNTKWNTKLKSMRITILHDPIPVEEGGFSPGARLRSEELEAGIRLNSFVPGMKFKERISRRNQYKYYIIVETPNGIAKQQARGYKGCMTANTH